MNFLISVIAWILPTKDVTALVAQLDKLAAKLLEAEKAELEKADRLTAQVNELLQARDAARTEAARAARVASNVSDLIA